MTPKIGYFNKTVIRAALLGIIALFVNIISRSIFPNSELLPLGNFFLFLSAGAYGVAGAIVSSCIAALPDCLFPSGDAFDAANLVLSLRLIVLCTAIGYWNRQSDQLIEVVITLFCWVCAFIPLSIILNLSGIHLDTRQLFLAGISDFLFVTLSSTALLSSTIYHRLTGQLRFVTLPSLLTHVMSAAAIVSLFALLVIPVRGPSTLTDIITGQNVIMVGCLLLLMVAFPAFLGSRLSRLISKDYQDPTSGMLPNKRLMTFSGLSSEFWRRQDLEVEQKTVIAAAPGDSGAVKRSSQTDTPGIIPPENGICAINRNGTITFLNRKFRRFAEITTNDVIGKTISQVVINPDFQREIIALIEPTFEKGSRVVEIKINQLPDTLRFFEVTSQRSDTLVNSSMNDGPDSMIVTVKDITDRRTVESHLLQAKKVESLGSIVGGIAHAFNNALTSITGQASFARHSNDPNVAANSLDEIMHSAQNAGNIVRQLLDFASLDQHPMKVESLTKIIQERIDFLGKSIGEDFEIKFDHTDASTLILSNTNLLMQALTNLILNAKEAYTSGAGPIFISLDVEEIDEAVSELHVGARPGRFARLRVRDQGVGMTPETLARAFDPLYTTKSSTGHAGLGLSIVFAIVRAHDGFLTAESHPQKGTIVTIYLPLRAESAATAVEAEPTVRSTNGSHKEALHRGNGESVLIIEDERTVRDMVALMLRSLGYKPTTCTNGFEAIEAVKKDAFDLVISDLVLPKMTGTETLKRLREIASDIPAILMTGYGISSDSVPQDVHLLHKPFDMDSLALCVRDTLRARRSGTSVSIT